MINRNKFLVCVSLLAISLLSSLELVAAELAIQSNDTAVYLQWSHAASAYRIERAEGKDSYRVLARVVPVTDLKAAQKLLSDAPDALSRALSLKDDFQNQIQQNPELDNSLINASAGYAQLRARAYLDRDVSRNKHYRYRVIALAANGTESVIGEIETDTANTKPPAPTLRATLVGDFPQLNFTATAVVRYQLERSEQSTGPWQAISLIPLIAASNGDTLRHDDNGAPLDGKTYFYRIVPSNVFEQSGPASAVVSIATPDRTPPEPPQVAPADSQPAAVTISWQASTEKDIAGYHVFRQELQRVDAKTDAKINTGEAKRLTSTLLGTTATRFEDRDLVPGQVYQYTLTATDRAGNVSKPSTPVLARPRDTQAPAAPKTLQARVGEQGQVTLSWQASRETDLYAYRLYRGVDDNKPTFVRELMAKNLNANERVSHIETLDVNSEATYSYAITAVDATENESPQSEKINVQLPDLVAPAAPAIAAIQAVNGAIEIAWQPSSAGDVAGYHVHRGATPDALLRMTKQVLSANTRGWRDEGVKPGVTLYYAVSAVDRAGNVSALSDARSGATFSAANPAAPTALTLVRSGKDWQLNWKAAVDASGYVVYVSTSGDKNFKQFGALVTATSITIPAAVREARWYCVQSTYTNGAVSALSKPLAVQLSASEVAR